MSASTKPNWKTPNLDVNIDPTLENIENQIRKLVLRIKPDWLDDQVRMKKLAGGVVNIMYCCWSARLGQDVDSIVVRIHQRPPDVEENSANDAKNEIELLEKISSTDIGPNLLVLFNNGLCYSYLPGETLNAQTVRSEKFIPHVTKLLARLHSLPLMERETSWGFKDALDWMQTYPPTLEDPIKLKRLLEVLPDMKTLLEEMDYLEKYLPTLGSPRVFCHNDTKGENFVWNEKEGKLRLIDFEYSGNNTQAFEIGHHFASYNDILDSTPDTYPDRDFQLRWIRQYLQYWYEYTGKKASDVTDKDVERLYVQSNKYAQMSRLLIGAGMLPEGYFEFCLNNLKDYFKFKDQVNAMVLPE